MRFVVERYGPDAGLSMSLIDLAFRLKVEQPPSRTLGWTYWLVRRAQALRRAKPPVLILVVGAGVNVKQPDPRIADCERAVREALGF